MATITAAVAMTHNPRIFWNAEGAPPDERQWVYSTFGKVSELLLATRPFSIEGRPRTITGSVGAVLLDDARPGQDALEAAGRLVKKAKQTRNTAVADAAPQTASKSQLSRAARA